MKTSFVNFIKKEKDNDSKFISKNLNDICSSIQFSLIKNITNKIELAVEKTKIKSVALGGGVSGNSYLRGFLFEKEKKEKWKVFVPPMDYTTDNAAMIGLVGYLKFKKNYYSNLNHVVKSKMEF